MTADQIRAVALSLPGVTERVTWGRPTFRVRDRLFATLAPDGSSATLKSSPEEQHALVGTEPETFMVAAYVGRHGWISALLERADHDLMEELVIGAWRRAAPKNLLIEHPTLR